MRIKNEKKLTYILLLMSIPSIAVSLERLNLVIPVTQLQEHNATTLTVEGTYSDGETKPLSSGITWQISDPNVIQAEWQKLIAKGEGTATLRAKVAGILSPERSITVYKVINGHRLPPEPDPAINNSTLLGIDSNDNGVRDDVERAIYFHYRHPIEQAFIMQYATRYQKVLEDPEGAAESKTLQQEHWNLYSCKGYLRTINVTPPKNSVQFLENAYFNTRERMRAYIEFNDAMSGGVYHIPFHDKDMQKENCDFNITQMLEMEE